MRSCFRPGCLLLALAAAACSTGTRSTEVTSPRPAQLREVANLLQQYGDEFRRGPARPAADLARYQSVFPLGYQAVKSGEIVVVPGSTMPGEGDAKNATTAVVAYEKDAPTQGGWVLLHNGTVQEMTAEQFKAAPKAP